jgi:hypothetical protein
LKISESKRNYGWVGFDREYFVSVSASLGVSCRFENKRKKGEEKKNSEDDDDW